MGGKPSEEQNDAFVGSGSVIIWRLPCSTWITTSDNELIKRQ